MARAVEVDAHAEVEVRFGLAADHRGEMEHRRRCPRRSVARRSARIGDVAGERIRPARSLDGGGGTTSTSMSRSMAAGRPSGPVSVPRSSSFFARRCPRKPAPPVIKTSWVLTATPGLGCDSTSIAEMSSVIAECHLPSSSISRRHARRDGLEAAHVGPQRLGHRRPSRPAAGSSPGSRSACGRPRGRIRSACARTPPCRCPAGRNLMLARRAWNASVLLQDEISR